MKRFTVLTMTLVLIMSIPVAAMAMKGMEHGKDKAEEMKHHGGMEHADKSKHMDHEMGKGHDKHGDHDMSSDDFVEVGKDAQKGVVATVKVKTYDDETKEKMAKMGMDATHHVMVLFTDEQSGSAVVGGKAALKVKGQDDKPAMLMQMGEGFGADVKLEGKMNTFEIGTKLDDGKKRQFKVMFHNM